MMMIKYPHCTAYVATLNRFDIAVRFLSTPWNLMGPRSLWSDLERFGFAFTHGNSSKWSSRDHLGTFQNATWHKQTVATLYHNTGNGITENHFSPDECLDMFRCVLEKFATDVCVWMVGRHAGIARASA